METHVCPTVSNGVVEVSPKTCLKCSIFAHLVDNALNAMHMILSVQVTASTLCDDTARMCTSKLHYTIHFIPPSPQPPRLKSNTVYFLQRVITAVKIIGVVCFWRLRVLDNMEKRRTTIFIFYRILLQILSLK